MRSNARCWRLTPHFDWLRRRFPGDPRLYLSETAYVFRVLAMLYSPDELADIFAGRRSARFAFSDLDVEQRRSLGAVSYLPQQRSATLVENPGSIRWRVRVRTGQQHSASVATEFLRDDTVLPMHTVRMGGDGEPTP